MQLTDPKGWILLTSFTVVLVTAVVWSVFGLLPQSVAGMGILVKSGGVFEVVSLGSGRIADVAVSVGDEVTEGQVIARLSQPELADKLREARAVLAELVGQQADIAAHGSRDLTLQTTLLVQQRHTVEQGIAAAEQSIKWYEEKIGIQEKLVQDGLLTKQTLLTTRQQLDEARQRVSDGHSQLAQIAVKELDLHNRRDEEGRGSQTRIDQQERIIAELERDLRSGTEIVAQRTGHVLEILTEQGAMVNRGDPVLTLDLMGRTVKDLEAIIYVPSVYGKQVKVGMTALVAPSTVKQEEYGMMLGRVTYVSDFPATSRGMRRVLKNEKLISGLAGADAPYEIHADLLIDANTASKYKWSSSQGPPLKIQSGTLASAQITVATRRPVEMVIPLIKKYTGI
jgi:HlyD family secretion protein